MPFKGFPLPCPWESVRPRAEGWQRGAVAAVTGDKLGSCSRPRGEEPRARPATAMWGLPRGSRLLAALLRTPRAPRARISSAPPEHPLSTAVSSFGGRGAENKKDGGGRSHLLAGVRGVNPPPLHYSQIILVGSESKRGGGRKRRCPQSSTQGGACPAPTLGLSLPFYFILSAPFLTFGGYGSC